MAIIILSSCILFICLSLLLPLVLKTIASSSITYGQAIDQASNETVTIIIPAYNEEDCIVEKLVNLAERCGELTPFPEVLIGSDGSVDNTVRLASTFIEENKLANWQVLDLPNEGKCSTINRLVEKSSGDIIISTDCDTTLHAYSISELVQAMRAAPEVGSMSSVPFYDLGKASIQEKYWSVDLAIREEESRLGLLIVLNGWLYGFRKTAFSPIPSGVMADDLWIPLSVILNGWQSRQCRESVVSCERTNEEAELFRRCRVIAGGMDVVARIWFKLLKKPSVLALVFAHKINRWMLVFWILAAAASVLFIYTFTVGQMFSLALFFALVLCVRRIRNILITLSLPVLALFKVMKSRDLGKWEHTGREKL